MAYETIHFLFLTFMIIRKNDIIKRIDPASKIAFDILNKLSIKTAKITANTPALCITI